MFKGLEFHSLHIALLAVHDVETGSCDALYAAALQVEDLLTFLLAKECLFDVGGHAAVEAEGELRGIGSCRVGQVNLVGRALEVATFVGVLRALGHELLKVEAAGELAIVEAITACLVPLFSILYYKIVAA